jgi:pimeloyl-ACP methyl ester carboxylesterase
MSHLARVARRLLWLAALVLAPFAATAAEPPPLAAFGSLPDIENMALSNDGSRLAAVMTIGGERVVLLMTAQLDAPILLIHGKDDIVVPFEQSAKMADALKDAGKPHRLVVLREEDHWLSRAPTRRQMLEEAVAFVAQHNPAD